MEEPEDARPLVATADPALRAAATRWCTAAGAPPEVADDVTALRRGWRSASAVVVGADLAADVGPDALPRRDRVLLLAHAADEAWPLAVAVGATDVLDVGAEQVALRTVAHALDGRREGCLVAVVGAVGGSCASTFAAVLAHAAARRGHEPVVVDADPDAGGLDLLVGAERRDGARWGDLDAAGGPLSARALAAALPRAAAPGGEVPVLTWRRGGADADPLPSLEVVAAAVRGFDLVVADVPRHRVGHDDLVLATALLTVLLVPDDVRSLAAAQRLLPRLAADTAQVTTVGVRRPGGVGRSGLAEVLDRPVLGRLVPRREVRVAVDQGRGPWRWRSGQRVAGAVLDLLGLEAR